jgi:anaerobic magnesium-protoporphyrin IX monomethyl ester cyclase
MAQIILFNPSNGLLMDKLDIWPPWALICLSTNLYKEYSICIIDGRFEKNWKQILDKELNQDTLCVGVTALTGLQLKFAVEFLQEIKKKVPDVKTVMGGIHVTSTPEDSIREPLVDFVVRGDGETIFYNLVKTIEKNGPYENIKGLCFKDKSGNPIINLSEDFEDLNAAQDPPLHLVDVERYVSLENSRRKLILFSSRGCPFGCSYCHNSSKHNMRRWRYLSAEKTIAFMKTLVKRYNITHFVFQDDNFWVSVPRVESFVSLIEENSMDITWAVHGATITNLRYITLKIAQRLKKSGLQKILCGIETASPKLQKVVGKFIEMKDLYAVNKIMSEAGIKMIYSFMSGFPTETIEDIKISLNVMFEIKKESPHNDIGNMKPVICYPGTKLFDWAVQNGFNPPKTFEGWSGYSWNNYDKIDYPWIDKRRKNLLQNLYFTTLMLNPDYEYIKNPVWKFLCNILYPITRWRVKNLYFNFSPSLFALKLIKKMNLT